MHEMKTCCNLVSTGLKRVVNHVTIYAVSHLIIQRVDRRA